MAAFTFVNDTSLDISIDFIVCPGPFDCNDDEILGDDRYDTDIVKANDELNISTDCSKICWRPSENIQWNRTRNQIIRL